MKYIDDLSIFGEPMSRIINNVIFITKSDAFYPTCPSRKRGPKSFQLLTGFPLN